MTGPLAISSEVQVIEREHAPWNAALTDPTFIFQSAVKKKKRRSGCFQCEQLLHCVAAARTGMSSVSGHDAERSVTSWPPRNRNRDERRSGREGTHQMFSMLLTDSLLSALRLPTLTPSLHPDLKPL